jgi:hypothetical protein
VIRNEVIRRFANSCVQLISAILKIELSPGTF